MGILDDAIREHLELKRQHGAESDDLERLENEAFGALARPGDPDFAEPGDDAEAQDASAETDAAAADSAPAGGSTSDWLADDPTPVASGTDPGPTAAEQARADHPHLEDTADHDGPEAEALTEVVESPPPLAEPLPPSGAAEPAPPEAPERGIFDADADADSGDLDLDLGDFDLEEEEDDGTVNPQPAAQEPSSFLLEEEDLSLDLDDDEPLAADRAAAPFADPATEVAPRAPMVEEDTGNPPLPVPPRSADLDEGASSKQSLADDEDGEDLLEETPDFLRDTPEGDQAWFEQDPPKDFDFDD